MEGESRGGWRWGYKSGVCGEKVQYYKGMVSKWGAQLPAIKSIS